MRLAAESLGIGAAEILNAGDAGMVIAVFTRSLYLRFPAGLVCLGAPEIGRGPLNVPCRAPSTLQWQSAAKPGVPAAVDGASIHVSHLRIGIDSAEIWTPPPLPAWSGQTTRVGMERLRAALPLDLPEGGLGAILVAPAAARRSDDPVLRAAMPAIDTLMGWVAAGAPAELPEAALCSLLGLGPGLTPSGDDFLGGVLVALRLAGGTAAAERMGRAIEHFGPDRTNEISLAHLRATIRFSLAEKLHEVTADILRGEAGTHRASLARLSEAAHHSPWDTLAGLSSALAALFGQPVPAPKADQSVA